MRIFEEVSHLPINAELASDAPFVFAEAVAEDYRVVVNASESYVVEVIFGVRTGALGNTAL
jgi:hypothetical protein